MSTSFSSHITLSIPNSYQSLILFSFLLFCHLKILCKWDTLYNLGDWLFSLRIDSLRWSQIFVYIDCLFFFFFKLLSSITWNGQTTICLPFTLIERHLKVSSFSWFLVITNKVPMWKKCFHLSEKKKKQKTAQEGNYGVVFLLHFIIMYLSL